MRLSRVPGFLLVAALVGLVVVVSMMITGPIIGNSFSTINQSLRSVNGPAAAATSQHGQSYGPTRAVANPQPGSGAAPAPTGQAPIPVAPGPVRPNQMVVKNAEMQVLVEDTDRAMDGVSQTVSDVQGYVISSRTWYQAYHGNNYKYATLTIGVPVDQFENAMRRLRSLAIQVLNENGSGQDVSNEYVDLQSQVANLEATRDRVKTFLDQATTVDDVLRIDLELSRVEAQIEQRKGQMNYLAGRSAFSTITINLEPQLPKIAPRPTATAAPTPVAGLAPWDAGETTQHATDTLVSIYRVIAKVLIWFFVVIVPVFGPPAVLVWLVMWFIRRRNKPLVKKEEV